MRPAKLDERIRAYQAEHGVMPESCRMGVENYCELWDEVEAEEWWPAVGQREDGCYTFHGVLIRLGDLPYNEIEFGG